jgi:hypothetical protein
VNPLPSPRVGLHRPTPHETSNDASACAFTLALTPTLALRAADWPQFRGPGGSGVADDQKPPTKFGPKDNLAWKVAVPPGASSPIVVGDKLILTAFEGGKLLTICYSCRDGKELWRADAGAKAIEPFHPTEGSPAASTPASDGKTVVSYFGSCGLIAYDLGGKELWRFVLPTAVTNNEFGSGTSPVLGGLPSGVEDTAKPARKGADGLVLLARDLSKDSRCTRSTSPPVAEVEGRAQAGHLLRQPDRVGRTASGRCW